jgi:hypothetical protein
MTREIRATDVDAGQDGGVMENVVADLGPDHHDPHLAKSAS